MLANFAIAVEAVLPIFLLIFLGMGARRLKCNFTENRIE